MKLFTFFLSIDSKIFRWTTSKLAQNLSLLSVYLFMFIHIRLACNAVYVCLKSISSVIRTGIMHSVHINFKGTVCCSIQSAALSKETCISMVWSLGLALQHSGLPMNGSRVTSRHNVMSRYEHSLRVGHQLSQNDGRVVSNRQRIRVFWRLCHSHWSQTPTRRCCEWSKRYSSACHHCQYLSQQHTLIIWHWVFCGYLGLMRYFWIKLLVAKVAFLSVCVCVFEWTVWKCSCTCQTHPYNVIAIG